MKRPVRVDDVYSGDVGVAAIAAGNVGSPISFAMQSGFDALKLKSVTLQIGAVERRRQQEVIDVMAPRTVHPGEDLDLTVVMAGPNGQEISRRVSYRVPMGVPTGTLNFTIADATATNVIEYQQAVGTPQRTPRQVLESAERLALQYERLPARVARRAAYTVEGRDLPDPPPSLALVFTRAQATFLNTQLNTRGAKLAELEVKGSPGFIVTGTKTVQVEVKE